MNPVRVIPAIDLKGGRCVRLRQGRADEETVYSADPVAMAVHWAEEGATFLHVVDLDGAFAGRPAHQELIRRIVEALSIPVEVGGGLRTDADIETTLALGVRRVIIGTRALAAPDDLRALVARFGDRVVVGIDARAGLVQVRGWTETTDLKATDLARRAAELGVKTLIYTDTATDGMMRGVNLAAVDEVCATAAADVIASGGISSPRDMEGLRALNRPNLVGAIVGKALYEGRVTFRELQG